MVAIQSKAYQALYAIRLVAVAFVARDKRDVASPHSSLAYIAPRNTIDSAPFGYWTSIVPAPPPHACPVATTPVAILVA